MEHRTSWVMRPLRAPLVAVAVCALVLLLAACGNDTVRDATTGSASKEPSSTTPVPDDPLVGCWGSPPGWRASAMAGAGPDLISEERLRAAFADLLADDAGAEMATMFLTDGVDTPYVVLGSGEDAAIVLGLGDWSADGPGEGARTFEIAPDETGDGEWRWLGGGDCRRLMPVAEAGTTWVSIEGVSGALDPDATSVRLRITETSCTGARDPRPHLLDPVVVETDTSVTVSLRAESPGSATCPGNPTVDYTLELPTPLGDRALLDGSRFPSRPVS